MTEWSIEVADNADRHRYEAREADGSVVGFAEYHTSGTTVVFTHTQVDDSQEGKGVGSLLVRQALDDVRDRGLRVRPLCPFVRGYIERHGEYADLVDATRRAPADG